MKITYILLIILLIVAYAANKKVNAAEGWYFEAGISVHDVRNDYPEIYNMPNPLGHVDIGYTIKYKHKPKEHLDIFIRHTSSIPYTEDGLGLNQIGIQYRVYR